MRRLEGVIDATGGDTSVFSMISNLSCNYHAKSVIIKLEQGRQNIVAKKTIRKTRRKPKETAPALPGAQIAPAPVPPPIAAEIALRERQSGEQKWTEKGKVRKTVSAIVALKIQGFSTAEIAEQLSIKPASVRQYLWIAGKNGWLTTHDPHEIAHSQLVHRAVSNLDEWLHARDARTGLPDKEVMLESLKGLSVFGGGAPAQQPEGGATNVLAIQITMPVSNNLPQMREGNDGGRPAYIDGQVLDDSHTRRQLTE